MKIRICLLLLSICIFIVPSACAALWTDKSINEYTDKQFKERLDPFKEEMGNRTQNLEALVSQQSDTINKLIEQLKEVQTPPAGTPAWIKAVASLIVALILAIVGFLFWPRKANAGPVDIRGNPKCPRCGWEHAPGDTVCKNPACKTQF